MRAGDTFTFRDTTLDNHLWAVISDPLMDVADPVVIVSFTTYKEGKDPTCILQAGDHPFIRHPTTVHYIGALDVSNSGLEARANRSELILQGPLNPHVLHRIRHGAAESPFIPEGCRKILVQQGLIE
jgi:hypothetical protein